MIEKRGKWKEFEENGEAFLSDQDYKSLDLDVLGQNSLYQMICVAFTQQGKKQLADYLIQDSSYDQMMESQKAVKELADMPEFVVRLETLGSMIPEQKKNGIEKWMAYIQNQSIPTLITIFIYYTFDYLL